jgi:hypothetical protein
MCYVGSERCRHVRQFSIMKGVCDMSRYGGFYKVRELKGGVYTVYWREYS